MTDSRGLFPDDGQNWVDFFVAYNPQHKIGKYNWNSGRICTIFRKASSPILEGNFDLIILQTGYHEYVLEWSKFTHFSRIGCDDPDYESRLTEIKPNKYRYRNDPKVRESIEKIKTHTKNLLLIGLHGYAPTHAEDEPGRANYWNGLAVPAVPDDDNLLQQHSIMNAILTMNQIYSEGGVDYLDLPVHLDWAKKYSFDGQHYTESGHRFICEYVERYINRLNKRVTDVILGS